MVPAMIVLTLSRVRVAVPLASPAAPAALRAAWTVPALFASAAQVHIAHAVDFAHRHQRPGLTVALGWLGAVGLAAFVVADLRLLRRIGTALDARDGSRPVAPDGDQLLGFAAASYVKRSLAWNLACAVLAAGSVLWAGFNGGGTYGW